MVRFRCLWLFRLDDFKPFFPSTDPLDARDLCSVQGGFVIRRIGSVLQKGGRLGTDTAAVASLIQGLSDRLHS